MTHPRTQIRQAFRDRLIDATAAEERVYIGRLMPLEEPELPAIVVHTREPEEIQSRSISGWKGYERRRCVVSVVCSAQSFEAVRPAKSGDVPGPAALPEKEHEP